MINNIRVEYLILLRNKSNFCDSIDAFKNFLKADSSILLEEKKIKYQNIEVDYTIQRGTVNEQNFFHIKFIYKKEDKLDEIDEKKIDTYVELLKCFRTNVYLLGIEFNTLWDDISLYYSMKSYPLIYEIENLMRKLITKFMLTNVGISWVNETLPQEIKSVVSSNRNKGRKEKSNFLYEIDFIHLADFLFKPYHTNDINVLYKKIKNVKRIDDLDLEELKSFLPKSNWQRYFFDLIKYEDSRFQTQWEDLYQLRCQLAHSNTLTKDDYCKIFQLVNELKEKLQEAVDKLDKIEVPEDDKESIAENVAGNLNYLSGEFIQLWRELEAEIIRLFIISNSSLNKYLLEENKLPTGTRFSPRELLDELREIKLISDDIYIQILKLFKFRNQLVHSTDTVFEELDISDQILKLKEIMNYLKDIPPISDILDSD